MNGVRSERGSLGRRGDVLAGRRAGGPGGRRGRRGRRGGRGRARARAALRRILDWGLVDIFRQHHAEAGFYSWWDYRQLGFPKNNGLRIDQILATASLATRCTAASIDREARKGKQPSDHAPVIAVFGD